MKFTDQQQSAIDYNLPRPLLVSAAAGSGKTAVLINRIYERLLDNKVQVENLLVMTFTQKAALQMRQKLEEKISEIMEKSQNQVQLKRLRDIKKRIPLAQISTIHSFCLNLIREYQAFLTDEDDELLLSGAINNISETQGAIYLDQALDDVLNFIYQQVADLENAKQMGKNLVTKKLPGLKDNLKLFSIMDEAVTQEEWLKDFEELAFALTESFTDLAMRDHILSMHKQFKSLPYYEDQVIAAFKDYQAKCQNFSQSDFVEEQLSELKEKIGPALVAITEVKSNPFYLDAVKNYGKKNSQEKNKLVDNLPIEEEVLRQIKEVLASGQDNLQKWQAIKDLGDQLGDPILLRKGGKDQAKLDIIYKYEPAALPAIGLLNKNFNPNSAGATRNNLTDLVPIFTVDLIDLASSMTKMLPLLARFIEIIILCDRRFQELKRRYQLIDFNDYEHYALKLLDQADVAKAVKDQYQEIYIDEYQDTNPIQEMIVNRIGSPKTFMVGDLKQSIYRFRQADPGLFKDKLDRFLPYQTKQAKQVWADRQLPGFYILLNKNFRSSETILEGINQLFTWLMREDLAELDYNQDQKLIPGNQSLFEESIGKKKIQFKAIQMPNEKAEEKDDNKEDKTGLLDEMETFHEETDDNLVRKHLKVLENIELVSQQDSSYVIEALQAVRLIQEGLSQGKKYEDYAILARNHKICQIYVEVLSAYKIPVNGKAEKNYLNSQELRFLIQLINLLDNKRQDIPLVSVMRSNIFGLAFDENELLVLKLTNPHMKFYHENIENILSMGKENFVQKLEAELKNFKTSYFEKLYTKIESFNQTIDQLREKANWLSISELLDYIFQIADYPGQLANLPFAESRLDDVERFQEWAFDFTSDRGSGLHDFCHYIQKIIDQDLSVDDFDQALATDNSVSIMTIHASKGLEFKHVILAGSNRNIFGHKKESLFLFDPDYGFAAYTADAESQVLHGNPSILEYKKLEAKKLWSEEYRLLYVAMTRAEEDLTILAHLPKTTRIQTQMPNLYASLSQNLQQNNLYSLRTYAEILMAFFCQKKQTLLDYFVVKNLADQGGSYFNLDNFDIEIRTEEDFIQTFAKDQEKLGQVSDVLKESLGESQANLDLLAQIDLADQKAKQDLLRLELEGPSSKAQINRIKKLLSPIEDPLAQVPAKITVTEIKKAFQALAIEEQEIDILPDGMAEMSYTLRKPNIHRARTDNLRSGTEFGSFIHELMYFINPHAYDLEDKENWRNIYEAEINQLISQHKIKKTQEDLADYSYELVEKFLSSDLAQRIKGAQKRGQPIYRETPFTLAIPAYDFEQIQRGQISPNQAKIQSTFDKTDQILLQGMIDLWFIEDGKVVLVDYKSDYIPQADKQVILKERYDIQLKYYAMAIEKIMSLKDPIKEKCIWLLREGKAYQM